MSKSKEVIKPEFTCIREGSAPKLRDQTQLIHYAIGKSNDVDVIQRRC